MAIHLLMRFGPDASEILDWVALLLTYCTHALTWTLVATLLSRRTALLAAKKNSLWKLALLGPLATAAVSAALPLGNIWTVASPVAQHIATAPASHEARAAAVSSASQPSAAAIHDNVSAVWAARGSFESRLLAVLLVGAFVVGLFRFGTSAMQLLRVLRGRTTVRDARLAARFEQLRKRAGLPRALLTESRRVPGPLVVGGREICIPGDLCDYTDGEVDAIFAHELAHLERHDGLWFPIVGLVESVFWIQPLNHWVSARYRQSAELACDDRAVELTGAPMDLARALMRLAETALPSGGRVLLPAMASCGSARFERVQRLVSAIGVEATGPGAQPSKRRDHYVPVLCFAVLGIASPSLGVESAHVQPSRRAVASAERAITGPNPAVYRETMSALAAQAQQLETQLALLPDHAGTNPANAMELLGLRQALRHVRATQAWTEQRFERECEAWQRNQPRANRGNTGP